MFYNQLHYVYIIISTLLITGGTGSFGNMIQRRFLKSDIKEVLIFNRDVKKQDDMRSTGDLSFPGFISNILYR